jgi:hypothetical protein
MAFMCRPSPVFIERGVAGSDAAWAKVTTNITNLSTWSAGFGPEPRWGTYLRNK